MALSNPTSLAAAVTSSGSGVLTTGSFTPAANSLILVVCTMTDSSTSTACVLNITDTLGTLSWTKVEESLNPSGRDSTATIFYAIAPASPTAGTVTVSTHNGSGGTYTGINWGVFVQPFQVTGGKTSSPVGATGIAGGTTLGAALSTAPASTSLVVTAIAAEGTGAILTVPSGFTQLYNTKAGYDDTSGVAYQSGSAPQTATWGATSYNCDSVVAIEILNGTVAPNAPSLISPANNATLDRSLTQRFTWAFSGSTGDTQSEFDLQYRIGAGAWSTISGTTANNYVDIAGGTFSAASYEWQVRTTGSTGLVGPYSSSLFFTAADAPATPTITTPTSGATVGPTQDVTWSTSSQTDYQIRTVADNAGAADPTTIYTDSGDVLDSVTRTASRSFAVNGRYEHIQVRIKSAGLWLAWADCRVLVSYTPPATPTLIATPSNTLGSISVAVTNPAPGAGQPTVISWDVLRRETSTGGAGDRLAAGIATTPWIDRTPASLVDYQYLIRSWGSNNTSTDSAWTG